MNDNLLFRATRYPAQFPVFNSVDLTPMGAWELDPNPLMACQPCNLSAAVTVEAGAASLNVEGANGTFVRPHGSWMAWKCAPAKRLDWMVRVRKLPLP